MVQLTAPRLWLPVVALLAGATLVAGMPGPGGTGAPAAMEEGPVPDEPYRILKDETVLAVVVQTTGIASRFAPDHLIYAAEYELTFKIDPDRPEETRFSAQVRVADLVIDEPSMLDAGQSDAAAHPVIEVEAVEVDRSDEDAFPWSITGALTVRGARAEVPLRDRLEQEGARIQIEAYGPVRFTDLGIEPYRAFLGAVRNRDEFHLYLSLVAEPAGEGVGEPPRAARASVARATAV